MKVQDAIDIVDNIDEVKQILYSADTEEGTHIDYGTVRKILDLLHGYQHHICRMDVVSE